MTLTYTLKDVQELIQLRLQYEAHEHDGDYYLNPDMKDGIVANAQKESAVLIGMIERHYRHLTPRLTKDMLTGKRYELSKDEYESSLL